jgi:hypothetical protein
LLVAVAVDTTTLVVEVLVAIATQLVQKLQVAIPLLNQRFLCCQHLR